MSLLFNRFTALKLQGRLLQAALFVLVTALVLLLASAVSPNSNNEGIVLRSGKLPFTPREFYIADIIDERKDKKAVAYLLPTGASTAAPAKAQPVDLKGGGLPALREYIRQSMPANTKLRPIVIRLKEMKVTEKSGAAGRVTGQIAVVMDFEFKRDDELVPLLQYKGGGQYERPVSRNEVTEPALSQSIGEALRYLNTWMDREANTNEKLARGLKIAFKDYKAASSRDTVFYDPSRPLRWEDFSAPVNPTSRFAASIFPSFEYDGNRQVINGVIHLDLTMKVYMLKSSSWAKESSKDAYGLNHEQKHFDIVKLVAERFKQKIKADELSLEDYNSNIQYLYIESYREMNELQDQYDSETRHGLDKVAQERWNQRLDKELKAMGAK